MAEIIGYDKRLVKQYKGICKSCGAIILFGEHELNDRYNSSNVVVSYGTCPGCGNHEVSVNKQQDYFREVSEYYGWPKANCHCIKNCKKCNDACCYRKQSFESNVDNDIFLEKCKDDEPIEKLV